MTDLDLDRLVALAANRLAFAEAYYDHEIAALVRAIPALVARVREAEQRATAWERRFQSHCETMDKLGFTKASEWQQRAEQAEAALAVAQEAHKHCCKPCGFPDCEPAKVCLADLQRAEALCAERTAERDEAVRLRFVWQRNAEEAAAGGARAMEERDHAQREVGRLREALASIQPTLLELNRLWDSVAEGWPYSGLKLIAGVRSGINTITAALAPAVEPGGKETAADAAEYNPVTGKFDGGRFS